MLPLPSNMLMAPRRRPAACGRNCTFTVHVVLVVPAMQVVPLDRTVKSRLGLPIVRGCTLPSVVLELNGWAAINYVALGLVFIAFLVIGLFRLRHPAGVSPSL